ncbi:hypothetical protein [Nonomuraea sp. KM90]|uniref:hypothetical protein n=1 Tax=Nonomuraea sp. KM90 TaxID=3457428 RepID=UPI003FCDD0C6
MPAASDEREGTKARGAGGSRRCSPRSGGAGSSTPAGFDATAAAASSATAAASPPYGLDEEFATDAVIQDRDPPTGPSGSGTRSDR